MAEETQEPAEQEEDVGAGLNVRQQRFCVEYVRCGNATEAATLAGYGPGNRDVARSTAVALLARPLISQHVRTLRKRDATVASLTRDRVLARLCAIAFADSNEVAWVEDGLVHVANRSQLTEDQRMAVASVEEVHGKHGTSIKIRMHSPTQALDLITKMQGWARETPPDVSAPRPTLVIPGVEIDPAPGGAEPGAEVQQ